MKGIDVIVEQAGSHYQIAVVRVFGQIDTTTSHELERRFQYLLKDRQFEIIIDLGRVNYISSAGWGIFISEIRGIRESGGDLKLVGMTPEVAEVFELLEFHNILESFKTVEAAVKRFETPKAAPAAHGGRSQAAESASTAPHEGEETSGTPHTSGLKDAGPAHADATGDTRTSRADSHPTTSGSEHADIGEKGTGRTDSGQAGVQQPVTGQPATGPSGGWPGGTGQATAGTGGAGQARVGWDAAGQAGPGRDAMDRLGQTEMIGNPIKAQGSSVSKDLEAMILEIVREHPDYGSIKIRKELLEHDYRRPINPLTLFMELKRLNLETREKRKRYADSLTVTGSRK